MNAVCVALCGLMFNDGLLGRAYQAFSQAGVSEHGSLSDGLTRSLTSVKKLISLIDNADPLQKCLLIIFIVVVIGLFGALGGMAFGIGDHRRELRNKIPTSLWRLLGDALIGTAAAFAALGLLHLLFTGWKHFQGIAQGRPESLVIVIGLSVAAGFAGLKMLRVVSDKLMDRIRDAEVQAANANKIASESKRQADELQDIKRTQAEAESYRIAAEQIIPYSQLDKREKNQEGETGKTGWEKLDPKQRDEYQKCLARAIKAYENLEKKDEKNDDALINQALIYRRIAFLVKHGKLTDKNLEAYSKKTLSDSINLFHNLIRDSPNNARAHYLLAAYKNIAKRPEYGGADYSDDEIKESLKKAISISESFRSHAKVDPDFKEFKALTEVVEG
ncbi:MAG: hypothetical protein P9M14_04780 [Candidatus Alcyoniella australis]|nr:hypothetical protein [Candidatus Alcyoniella australis]